MPQNDNHSGFKVDITLDRPKSVQGTQALDALLNATAPHGRQLTLLVKALLAESKITYKNQSGTVYYGRPANETQAGGLASYGATCLVVFFLVRSRNQPIKLPSHTMQPWERLSALFLAFLTFASAAERCGRIVFHR